MSIESNGGLGPIHNQDEARAAIDVLRDPINVLDAILIRTLAQRFEFTDKIGEIKAQYGLPVVDSGREDHVQQTAAELSAKLGLPESITKGVFDVILDQSKARQEIIDLSGGESTAERKAA